MISIASEWCDVRSDGSAVAWQHPGWKWWRQVVDARWMHRPFEPDVDVTQGARLHRSCWGARPRLRLAALVLERASRAPPLSFWIPRGSRALPGLVSEGLAGSARPAAMSISVSASRHGVLVATASVRPQLSGSAPCHEDDRVGRCLMSGQRRPGWFRRTSASIRMIASSPPRTRCGSEGSAT
jgi:hypothetical protein